MPLLGAPKDGIAVSPSAGSARRWTRERQAPYPLFGLSKALSPMAKASLTISSRNYSSWCLRGWLLCRFAGLDFEVEKVPLDDAGARAEPAPAGARRSSPRA